MSDQGLCTGCGTCVGVCPTQALEMRKIGAIYLPSLNEPENCIQCKFCLRVCPGSSIDFIELNKNYGFTHKNALIGNYIDCYLGCATDNSLRSASGGIVTTLLTFALERKFIDCAVVTTMNKNSPLEPKVIIAKTKKEILSASGSKYCPIPLNVQIRDLLKGGHRKIAFVGLPCHIHGIRKAEETLKDLKERTSLHIGLFCAHTINFNGTLFLLQKLGIEAGSVSEINYRSKGWWKGGLTIRLKNGSQKFLPKSDYWGGVFSNFFNPLRCLFCSDHTNELADISVGDAWLPELKGSKKGFSIILSRTKTGKEIIEGAKLKGKIKVIEIGVDDVIRSQRRNLLFKKKLLNSRKNLFRLLGYSTPIIRTKQRKSKATDYLRAMLIYINFQLSSRKISLKLLKYVPFTLLKIYSIFCNVIL